MGISGIPAIPMIITCLLQGTLCDTGIPCTFYGEKICSVDRSKMSEKRLTSFMDVPFCKFQTSSATTEESSKGLTLY